MHKRIRVVENICIMSECKYAYTHYTDKYVNPKTRPAVLKEVRKHFQREFKEQLGIKYFVPDPINGGTE